MKTAILAMTAALLTGGTTAPPDVRVDSGEASAALAILETLDEGGQPGEAQWTALFASEGFTRLVAREESLGRSLSQDDMRAYLSDPATIARLPEFRSSLAALPLDLASDAAGLASDYLPEGAPLAATVYLTIKPRQNEFVFDLAEDPAIFLVLDGDRSVAKLTNTMAHELHHIGLAGACLNDRPEPREGHPAGELYQWIGAFGEGAAMRAAAGSAAIHPHAVSTLEERAQWDASTQQLWDFMRTQDRVFADAVSGTIDDDALAGHMRDFYGLQGAWYVVGYHMASTIEQAFGKADSIAAFCRPETLLSRYNEAADAIGEGGFRWDPETARRLADAAP